MSPRTHTPRSAVEALARTPALPTGSGERFVGYGVMGLAFATGHVLGLRRWEASSIGPPYTSLWHRDPAGRWRVLADAPPHVSCARYLAPMIRDAMEMPVDLRWTAADAFEVRVEGIALAWQVRLVEHPLLSLLGGVAAVAPWAMRATPVRWAIEHVGAAAIDLGRVRLDGRMPNGQRFALTPRRLWRVAETEATLGGRSLGAVGRLPRPAMLGDFAVPDRGVFAIAEACFQPP